MRLFKGFVLGLFFLVISGGVCLAEDSTSNIKLAVKEFTLDNGMLFLIVERPTTRQIAGRFAIRAGSGTPMSDANNLRTWLGP